MDQLKKVLANIAAQLGGMGATQKLLLGSLGVIVLMGLFVVAQYTGASDMAPLLPGVSAGEQQRAAEALSQAGIRHEMRNGTLVVPVESQAQARAVVLQSGAGPSDTGLLFRNIIEKQSWQMSRQQNEQLFAVALQNELSGVISNFAGIEKATVIIDAPERQGLGRAVVMPSASATVFTRNGQALSQETVDGIASLIAGAKAGMRIEDVRVIDASHGGRQRRPSSEQDALPSMYLEHASKVESAMQSKLADQFAHIPGAVITVTAKVDVTRLQATTTKHLEKGDGTVSMLRRSTEKTNNSQQAAPGAEPGLGSNVTADITRAGGRSGSSMTEANEEREMENRIGTEVETRVDPKGMPTMIAVSMNVPKSYVAALLKPPAPAGAAPASAPAAEPSDADILKKFNDEIKPAIVSMILPHVVAMSGEVRSASDAAGVAKLLANNIAVSLIPGEFAFVGGTVVPVSAGSAAGTAGPGGLGGIFALGGGLIDKVVLGVLAVVSVGMMLLMVRKSAKRPDLPTAEEIVGLPPALEAKSDMIGEADESDSPLAGIEVNESAMAANKMLEQVTELVSKSPESAAKLINRWIQVEQ